MKKCFLFFVALLIYTNYSCSRNPYKATNKAYKQQVKTLAKTIRVFPSNEGLDSIVPMPYPVGTINFNLRKPDFVVIHHTAQDSIQQTLRTFTLVRTQVSAHYVIAKDGSVYHMLNDYLRAWHAGIASWGNNKDINSSSIGIELDNNGFEPFTMPQITSLLHLLTNLKKKYNIPAENFIGHGDIAPNARMTRTRFSHGSCWRKEALATGTTIPRIYRCHRILTACRHYALLDIMYRIARLQ